MPSCKKSHSIHKINYMQLVQKYVFKDGVDIY